MKNSLMMKSGHLDIKPLIRNKLSKGELFSIFFFIIIVKFVVGFVLFFQHRDIERGCL